MTYDRRPVVPVGQRDDCAAGWDEIAALIASAGARVIAIETYPGVRADDLKGLVDRLRPDLYIDLDTALRPAAEIDALVAADVTDDPVFGRLTRLEAEDFIDGTKAAALRAAISAVGGRVLVAGFGAALIAPDALVVHAGMPRWEGQVRQRRGEVTNLGAAPGATPQAMYKRSYFVDWRVADRLKQRLYPRISFLLDTTDRVQPKAVRADTAWRALAATAQRPFRVVPYFDPAPWGGQWMRKVCGLDAQAPNYGWCFDCVPEENSLLLGFGDLTLELPAQDLVLREPGRLLGEPVQRLFGAEFPIRFDLLDTVDGGNLSLQVHPLREYIAEQFGMAYTQDESYYMLEAVPGEASVFLGLMKGVDPAAFRADLEMAQAGQGSFPAERYVNRWPAKRHDHFSIPAGTVHCSGRGGVVLEISATPYIFTFKMWDWDRLGLDGRPRPIHLEHALASIRWDRDTEFVREQLINPLQPVAAGEGWREERTGLHELQFLDTHRHWFDRPVVHDAAGTVSVLNLVQGEGAVVESPDGVFDPFTVHFAETFIVPAAAGAFRIAPAGAGEHATIRARVRT